jgi:RimJ/RimL family protein N-acetyltransferase
MPEPVCLATDRLILRPWREADKEFFAKLNADPVVMEFFPSMLTRVESDAMADRIQSGFNERGWGLWAVEVTDQVASSDVPVGQNERRDAIPRGIPFIGYVGLSIPRFEAHFTPCTEIGWRLDREHWGQGYATEAAKAVCKFAFESLDLKEIVSFTSTINLRSRRVMERLGMTYLSDEDFDHPVLPSDHRLCRHVLYRLRRNDARAAESARELSP